MPRVFRRELPEVSNVAASKTATITLPIGQRYHSVLLQHGYASGTNTIAAALANITEVRVLINGKVQRKMTGQQVRDWNILHGTAYDCQGVPNTSPGVSLPIFFTEPWRKDNQDGMALAIPTVWNRGRFSTFKIEVDLGAASTPTLVAYAFTDDIQPILTSSRPIIAKVFQIQAVPGSTRYTISTLEKKDLLSQLTIYPDSGASQKPTQVTFTKNTVDIHKMTYAANFAFLTNNEMTPTASGRSADVYDLVLDHQDLLSGVENLADAASLLLTIEAASAMSASQTIVATTLGEPE